MFEFEENFCYAAIYLVKVTSLVSYNIRYAATLLLSESDVIIVHIISATLTLTLTPNPYPNFCYAATLLLSESDVTS